MRTETIPFREFMKNEPVKRSGKMGMTLTTAGAITYLTIPREAFAANVSTNGDSAFIGVLKTGFHFLDYAMIVVVMVAGVTWMFGHRTRGIELLLGGSIGYVVARHAVNIQEFLASLGGGIQ